MKELFNTNDFPYENFSGKTHFLFQKCVIQKPNQNVKKQMLRRLCITQNTLNFI